MPNDTAVAAPSGRAVALDALRGLSILAMVFCSSIPFGVLPAWMYHAQTPPPAHDFIPLPGLTWVDLVFPFFLFSMGAAMPLATRSRVEKGVSVWRLVLQSFGRAALLAFFAIYLEHVRPFVLNPSHKTPLIWLEALFGFLLLFAVFTRFPKNWPASGKSAIRIGGLLLMALLLACIKYPDGGGFSVDRSDCIIMFMSAMSWSAPLVLLCTFGNFAMRLGVMGVLVAVHFGYAQGGWLTHAAIPFPLPWLFQWDNLRYLCIVLPGTIAGELLCDRMRAASSEDETLAWGGAYAVFAVLMLAAIVATLYGLETRQTGATAAAAFFVLGAGWLVLPSVKEGAGLLLRKLYGWGNFWYFLGLLIEPCEGGIKKDPPTFAYYFVTTGLALFMLCALTVLCDVYKKPRAVGLLVDNGQNPMIAYGASANLVSSLLALTGIAAVLSALTQRPWLGVCRGAFETLLCALFVSLCTRKKIFWRT
jgi:predicted acyltransferase